MERPVTAFGADEYVQYGTREEPLEGGVGLAHGLIIVAFELCTQERLTYSANFFAESSPILSLGIGGSLSLALLVCR